MLTLAFAHAAAAACVAPVALSDLEGRLDRLDAALVAADGVAARVAVEAVRAEVPCLDRIPGPALVARLHRADGIGAFLDGPDPAGPVTLAFRAARRLDPTFVFDDAVLPPGHTLRALYEAADPSPAARDEALTRGRVGWWFDGAPVGRPVGAPTLAQRVDREGGVATSVLLGVGDPLPDVPEPERRAAAGPVAGGIAGVLAVAGGAALVLQAGGAWHRSAGAVVDADAHAWWAAEVRPAQTIGVALIGLGAAAAGLSTVWAIPLGDGAAVGVTARW